MRRRTFLAGLGFAALQLAGCAAKPQITPDYVLTYADNQPAGYPTTQGAQYVADLVQQQMYVIVVDVGGRHAAIVHPPHFRSGRMLGDRIADKQHAKPGILIADGKTLDLPDRRDGVFL